MVHAFQAAHTVRHDNSLALCFPLTVTEIADLAGGSRQPISCLLSRLCSRGILRREGKQWIVPRSSPWLKGILQNEPLRSLREDRNKV
jgi:predicted transcriptional regulator of viral defense system